MKRIYFLGLTLFCLNTANVFAEVPSIEKDKMENVNETVATTLTWEFFSAYEEPSIETLKSISKSCKLGEKSSYFYNLFKEINPAKRKATPIKNEKRFSEQKRKAMKIIKAILEIVSPLLLH